MHLDFARKSRRRCPPQELLLLLFALISPTYAQQVRHVQQQTTAGLVEGVVSADDKVRTFKGIPYAAPPVGRLRWRAPQPILPWTGTRRTIEYPARCMQGPPPAGMTFSDAGPSEDCLYLSMWMPAHPTVPRLPVMVWINGEGFAAGSTSEPQQDAGNLSKKGVLIVSFNYRLGVFGFLAHPELAKESTTQASGNYGLLDQIAALTWVHDNIASFGGDPENVTIFGAGSGSVSVSALLASPLSHGLFQRAIGEGGTCLEGSAAPRSRADAERLGLAFERSNFGSSSLLVLRRASASALLAAATQQPPNTFLPDIDGAFLRASCLASYRSKTQKHVPLLAGWDHDAADLALAQETRQWLDLQQGTGERMIFGYEFDQALPQVAGQAAALSSSAAGKRKEVAFVFQVLSSESLPWRSIDRSLAETVSSYWTNFAKTGNPNGPGLPLWPRYTSRAESAFMRLGSTTP